MMSVMQIMCVMSLQCFICIVCFFIGAKVGQKVVNKEPLEMPNLNPIIAVKEYEKNKEIEEADKKYKEDLEAINNYNGYL